MTRNAELTPMQEARIAMAKKRAAGGSIVINLDSHRLRKLDKLNWTIERRTPKGWAVQGYFPKLEQAANYLLTMGIGEAESIQELKACVEMARDAVLKAVAQGLHDLKEK